MAAVTTTTTGDVGAITFSWSDNGATTEDRTDLPAGTHTLTATFGDSCTATLGVTITQPPALSVTPTVTNVLCNGGNDGSIALVPSGGTPPYAYAATLTPFHANTQK